MYRHAAIVDWPKRKRHRHEVSGDRFGLADLLFPFQRYKPAIGGDCLVARVAKQVAGVRSAVQTPPELDGFLELSLRPKT